MCGVKELLQRTRTRLERCGRSGDSRALDQRVRSINLAVGACSRTSLSGTYVPKGGGLGNGLVMEKLEFGSGNSVTLTMIRRALQPPGPAGAAICRRDPISTTTYGFHVERT